MLSCEYECTYYLVRNSDAGTSGTIEERRHAGVAESGGVVLHFDRYAPMAASAGTAPIYAPTIRANPNRLSFLAIAVNTPPNTAPVIGNAIRTCRAFL